jgi:hypothetical protein
MGDGFEEDSMSACRFELQRGIAHSADTMWHQKGSRYVLRGAFLVALLLSYVYTAAGRTLLQGETLTNGRCAQIV